MFDYPKEATRFLLNLFLKKRRNLLGKAKQMESEYELLIKYFRLCIYVEKVKGQLIY